MLENASAPRTYSLVGIQHTLDRFSALSIYLHFYRSHFIRTFAPAIKTNSIFRHDTFLPHPD